VGGGAGGVGGGGGGVGGGAGGVGGGGGGCGGCRDAAGVCQSGTSVSSCGTKGQFCIVCGSGQVCQAGACTNVCTAANCPGGCCLNGACLVTSQQSAKACGFSGQTCAACLAGDACVFGKCSPAAICNSTNCSGCCSGNSCLPLPFQSVTNCGVNGNACMACFAGQVCTNGGCTQPPTCTAANCPGGCCDSGKCVPFSVQSSSFCGSGGQQCAQCAPGSFCSIGVCVQPPCSSATCSGCCSPNGCMAGTVPNACGRNGNVCSTCAFGQTCTSGNCTNSVKKIGDPCTSSSECGAIGGGGYCKFQTSTGNGQYLNGFCTRPCGFDGGSGCTVDSVCLNSLQPYGENDAFCSPRCSSASQCRAPGYACYFINSVSTTACWLNPIPIVGVDGGSPDAGASFIGSACINAGQCTNPSNAFCIQDVIPGLGASGFVGGYCSALCSSVACVSGSSCQSVTGFSSGITQQVCLRNCSGPRTGQANCRNGYVCEGTTGAAVGACLPRCNNTGATCPAGTGCNFATGYCN
ncbi:MAG: Myxococcales trans domain protein, partial [Myxococcaceae bacterium]|nr:Myxococcales trans domain protein [Myxococcaceae bacterium]